MNNNQICNLPLPTGQNQPTTLAFTDNKYLPRDGIAAMLNDLNMDNKKKLLIQYNQHLTQMLQTKSMWMIIKLMLEIILKLMKQTKWLEI